MSQKRIEITKMKKKEFKVVHLGCPNLDALNFYIFGFCLVGDHGKALLFISEDSFSSVSRSALYFPQG